MNSTAQSVHGNANDAEIIQIGGDYVQRLPISTNDIIFNPLDQMIYASRPSSVGSSGNSISRINPLTGEIASSVFVGSEPGKMALSDNGQALYVVLDGAFGVRQYDAVNQTAGYQVSLGNDTDLPMTGSDIAVAPGNPNVFAVARYRPQVSPPGGGVAVYSSGVRLPNVTHGHSDGANYLAFSNSPSLLYGGGLYSGLRTMTVDGSGVTLHPTGSAFGVGRIKYDNGLLYSASGQVIDPQSRTLLGTFATASSSAFVPESSVGRVYYAVRNSSDDSLTIKAFDINTYVLIGSLTIPNVSGEPTAMVRYKSNGLAIRTSDNQLFLVQTSLIPTGEPLPTPTATPTVTPTPAPTAFQNFTRQIPLASKDLVYSSATNKIYVSVPGTDSVRGNTLTSVDPATGNLENSVFIGSEPNKLAISENQQTIYTGIDGSGSIRKFDVVSQTASAPFYLAPDGNSIMNAGDIDFMPGSADTIAVSAQYNYGSTIIYDAGVRRTQPAYASGAMEFGTANEVYISGQPIVKYNVGTNGLTYSNGVLSGTSDFTFANGLIYMTNGRVIDPATKSVKGTFSGLGSTSLVTIDVPNNRAFFMTTSNTSGGFLIRAYDLTTYLPIGSIQLAIDFFYTPSSLVRWGENGLAFRGDNGKFFIIQSDLVSPSGTVPTPTPTPTITPTPTPAYIPTFVRQIDLPANDVVYSPATQSLYASVASSGGAGRGNTITKINPVTGALDNSVFIGSEPSRLALSPDGQILYAKLDGANATRRFDIQTQTAGLQFVSNPQMYDMKVMPGNSNTIAVASGTEGVSILDNGVARPNQSTGGAYGIYSIDFSDASTLFGYDSGSSEHALVKFTVSPNGVTGTRFGNGAISGYGNKIQYVNGRIYSSSGQVIDATTGNAVGMFQGGGGGTVMAIDVPAARAYFINRNDNNKLTVYDTETFRNLGSITLNGQIGTPTAMTRWGENGLAIRTLNSSNQGQLFILQSALIAPNAPVPTGIQMGASSYQGYESSSNLNVSVSRTGDLAGVSTIDYTTVDGTAVANQDYTPTSGTLTFAVGEASKILTIPIINDTIFEGGESFSLALSNPTGTNVQLVGPSTASATIFDNDNQPRIQANNLSVTEPVNGATADAVFTVRLSNPSTQNITVNYATSNGTAVSGSDYISANGVLTFAPLETSKTVTVQVLGDGNNEANELFYLNLSGAVNSSILTSQIAATIINFTPQPAIPAFDFDGDRKTDISIFRPTAGEWWYLRSSDLSNRACAFGSSSDKLVPADYTGDGKTDVAFWRESTGEWFILRSEDSSFYSFPFGSLGDIPAPADFDGDGRADPAVFRPSNATWYIVNSSDNSTTIAQFGASGDLPVAADYDGDSKADLAVFRPSDGSWWLNRTQAGLIVTNFGSSTDKTVQADYTGDGKADVAFFRPSSGEWFILRSEDFSFYSFPFGASGDTPTPGDYDGDGRTDPAVFRNSAATWYLLRSTSGFTALGFGASGDIPVPSAFVR